MISSLALLAASTLSILIATRPITPCVPIQPTTSRLNLIVTACADTSLRLVGASVVVEHRQCRTTVAVYQGLTDSLGRISFSIPNTGAGDSCVVVTDPVQFAPPDRSHRYVFRGAGSPASLSPGTWDLSDAFSTGCVDVKWPGAADTIECRYGP